MKTTNRVISEQAIAFIPTGVTWTIPADGAVYTLNVPIENYSDELNFEVNHDDIAVSIAGFSTRGVQLSVTVAGTVPAGSYNLRVISPGNYDNTALQGSLAGNHLNRITVVALGTFTVSGDDTIDLYGKVAAISADVLPSPITKAVDATLTNDEILVIASAGINITMPASPITGAKHTIHAGNNTVNIYANTGQNIIGNVFVTIEAYDTAVLQYIGSGNWIVS